MADDEADYLLKSPRTTNASRVRLVNAVYGAVDQDSASLSVNEEGPLLKYRADLVPGTKSFPTARARLCLVAVFFCYQVCGSSNGPLTSQYFYDRFYPDFFNDTGNVSSLTKSSRSKCDRNSSNPLVQQEALLQKHVSKFMMILSYSGVGPMVVATILLGSMSDVIGRRPLIILSCLSSFFKQIIYDVIMKFDLDLTYCFVGNVVDGMSGSFCTLMLAGFAFTADLTPPEKTRTNAIAIVEFFLQISYLAGQLTVGFLIQNLGYFYASLWPSAFVFMALCISVFFLPETVTHRGKGSIRRCVNPLKYVKNIFAFYVSAGTLKERALFCIAVMVLFLNWTAGMAHTSLLTIYQLGPPFCWLPEQIGMYGAVGTAIKAVTGLFAVHVLQKFLSDPIVIAIGLLSYSSSLVFEGLAQNDVMLYVGKCVSLT
ncbi:hypothetical protein BaRGS_00021635 [Batillaria attramentaria]|uniref:Proton-coupled folate transporter n=1 Tax=Batillaria attramentaria TaxID=370345 RepID=A0ABD0KIW9_9CAEN